jgi:hypothetical protein
VLSEDVVVVAFNVLGDAETVNVAWANSAALVTVVVYVWVVVPSCAVTIVVIVFVPTLRAIPLLALPDATVDPFTLTVELVSVTVGETVNDVVAFGTDAE